MMSEGDPRGELIALELRRPERWTLLTRWLASHLRLEPGGDHLYVAGNYLDWLDEPIGEFCRGISVSARIEEARAIVAAVAKRPRPWLTRIKIMAGFGTLALDDGFRAVVPNLYELELIGAHDLRAFVHPTVSKLRRSVNSLEGGNELALAMNLPAVSHCTLELEPWHDDWNSKHIMLHRLPALRTLDLAPSDPNGWGRNRKGFGHLDVFRWLRDLPVVAQLTSLIVPSVRTKDAAKHLRAIADAHPQLAIHIAQSYSRYPFGEALQPRVTIAPPWPWPPSDEDQPWEVRVTLPDRSTFDMFYSSLASTPEREFATQTEEFRTMWRDMWAVLDACKKRPTQIRFGLLHRAITAWRQGDPAESSEEIRNRVVAAAQKVAPEQLVTIAVRR